MFVTDHPAMKIGDYLVIADLHLGITRELWKSGISLPSQAKPLAERLNRLKKLTKTKNLVIVGDVKHSIPRISWQEMREVPEFLSLLEFGKIILIKGNHDGNLERLITDRRISVKKSFVIGSYFLTHGHRKAATKKPVIVIGHNQPHMRFVDAIGNSYSVPVWVVGGIKLRAGKLIIMPAFNELAGSSIVNESAFIGPVAKKLRNANAFLLDGTDLGKISSLQNRFGD